MTDNFDKKLTKILYRRACPDGIALGEYETGLLPEAQVRQIRQHVSECPRCQRELEQLRDFLQFFDIENIAEYIFRLTYILVLAFLLSGVYLHALLQSQDEKLSTGESTWYSSFLNWLAAVTVLVCVDLLFTFFVIIQFRYFFGGRANIALDGFTYAEYARRGFGELLAVAFISFLVFLGLSAITRREQARSRWAFSASGIVLVALVAVILVSAFQRLLLYEAAYGFTRIRTYTHVFMLWLGLLLAAMGACDRSALDVLPEDQTASDV
ncbi:MAG: DUF4173 domain-containing protein, partial [Anaerolineales bacterium]